MDNIEIIITPMTNAVGYYHYEREERVMAENERGKYLNSVDINRDFPYNQKSVEDCLNTIAGRTVYQIFA